MFLKIWRLSFAIDELDLLYCFFHLWASMEDVECIFYDLVQVWISWIMGCTIFVFGLLSVLSLSVAVVLES